MGLLRRQVFELPTVLAYPLFYKLVAPESSVVRKDGILSWMSGKTVRASQTTGMYVVAQGWSSMTVQYERHGP